MERVAFIEQEIQTLRDQLTHHRLYHQLAEIEDIKVFMEMHVYAVWDFMSLLKALQNHLTCTTLPWKPRKNPKIARFINEIVMGEESDVNEKGIPKSHFEMYLEAMDEVGADTSRILNFINGINDLENIHAKIHQAEIGNAEKQFLNFTFKMIQSNDPHKIASAFTFGREDLIPDMFIEIINQSGDNHFPKLTYYLERHIEIDGDEHGPLSLEMVKELCGNDERKWNEALDVAKMALQERICLWDTIADNIKMNKEEKMMDVDLLVG